MKNFIFKSDADFHKILFNKLDMILAELRHQRIDHVGFRTQLNILVNAQNLQKQVDDYFEENKPEDEPEHIPDSGTNYNK